MRCSPRTNDEERLMAKMTECRSCGATVATSAGTCPRCGATRTRVGNAVALAGLIVVLALLVWVVVRVG